MQIIRRKFGVQLSVKKSIVCYFSFSFRFIVFPNYGLGCKFFWTRFFKGIFSKFHRKFKRVNSLLLPPENMRKRKYLSICEVFVKFSGGVQGHYLFFFHFIFIIFFILLSWFSLDSRWVDGNYRFHRCFRVGFYLNWPKVIVKQ